MSARRCRDLRFSRRLPGLLLAVVALVSQLAVGAMVLPDDPVPRQEAALAALGVMCSSGVLAHPDPGVPQHRPGPARHVPGCAPLPLDFALAIPAFLPPSSPWLAARSVPGVRRPFLAPTARGPPSHSSHVGFPRGPPVLA